MLCCDVILESKIMKNNFISNTDIDASNWKKIKIEYLNKYLTLEVPTNCEILQMKPVPYLQNTPEAIEQAFENPVQSKTIEEIVSSHNKSADELTASIAVSDNTRPVPYNCTNKENILLPIIYRAEKSVLKNKISRLSLVPEPMLALLRIGIEEPLEKRPADCINCKTMTVMHRV